VPPEAVDGGRPAGARTMPIVLDATWRRRPVVLVGLMGTGKTSVGRPLAARLDRAFVDSDAQLDAATHATAKELAAHLGADELHRLEGQAVLAALELRPPAVVAAAAAVVLDDAVAGALARDAVVVWLRADTATLVRRVATGTHRPFVGDDARANLAAMGRDRADRYAAIADVTVDTAGRDPDAIAGEIADALAQQPDGAT
jgi:shikimate kinase